VIAAPTVMATGLDGGVGRGGLHSPRPEQKAGSGEVLGSKGRHRVPDAHTRGGRGGTAGGAAAGCGHGSLGRKGRVGPGVRLAIEGVGGGWTNPPRGEFNIPIEPGMRGRALGHWRLVSATVGMAQDWSSYWAEGNATPQPMYLRPGGGGAGDVTTQMLDR